MDSKIYYQKVREQEAKIPSDFAVVISRDTADGGKAGTKTEVPRRVAAKLVVEGLADLAPSDTPPSAPAAKEGPKEGKDNGPVPRR